MKTIAIIGAGPAGYTAAEYAAQNGLKVILFEEKKLGGICLNEGCIPTKTLLYATKLIQNAQNSTKYGIKIDHIDIDFGKIMARKNKIIRKLNAGIRTKLNHPNITTINEKAKFNSYTNGQIEIKTISKSYPVDYALICTGSQNFTPSIDGIKECNHLWTSTEALNTDTIPKELTIIGGGVIGIEFADFYNTLGTKVTIIEMMDEILNNMDRQLSQSLREILTQKGITFHLNSKVLKIENQTNIVFEKDQQKQTITTEKILISVGRKPNTTDIGLETIGIAQHKNGGIKINEQMQTNLPNVYAAGDVTGQSMLAHTASKEAQVAINNILNIDDHIYYHTIPSVVYTNPEIASVGEDEQALNEKGIKYRTQQLPMSFSGRFVAENEGSNGICKIISSAETNKILGVHLLGNPASEIITTATLAIEKKMTTEEWKKSVFPHPTVGEILKETLFE